MPENIAIIGPMPEEIQDLKSTMTINSEELWGDNIIYRGILWGKLVTLVKSGVGKVFAAATTQKIIDTYKPDTIILTGVAGALNHYYDIGDVVVGKEYIQHDYDVTELGFKRGQLAYTSKRIFESDKTLFEVAKDFSRNGNKVHQSRVLSGDQFLTKKEIDSFEYLTNEMKGDIVEMEAAAIAQVCWLNGDIPFICIKTISDKADSNAAVDFNEFMPQVVKNTHEYVRFMLENL